MFAKVAGASFEAGEELGAVNQGCRLFRFPFIVKLCCEGEDSFSGGLEAIGDVDDDVGFEVFELKVVEQVTGAVGCLWLAVPGGGELLQSGIVASLRHQL